MTSLQLQQQMIINKHNLNWYLRLKCAVLGTMTWSIWGYMAYIAITQWKQITTEPILEGFLLIEVLIGIFALVFSLVFLAIGWSFISKTDITPS